MAYIPFSPEVGCKYWLTGPDGTIAAFNDPTDPNYVGMLTDVTGLDSADVRESGDVLTDADGGWHGNFWYGRRPITLSGSVFGYAGPDARTARIDLLRRASNAMRDDAILSWQPNALNSLKMRTPVRRQQPLRITGPWIKEFQLQLVSAFAPLFSDTNYVTTGTMNIYPNPGMESNITGFGTYTTGATCAQSSAQAWTGTKSLAVTATGTTGITVTRNGVFPYDGTLVAPGKTVNVTAHFRPNTLLQTWKTTIKWYDINGALLSTVAGTAVTEASGTWVGTNDTFTVPANAYCYQLVFSRPTPTVVSEVHYIDGIQVVQDASAGYDPGNVNNPIAVENHGDAVSFPLYIINAEQGNEVNPDLINFSTGDTLQFHNNGGLTLSPAEFVVIDSANHLATKYSPFTSAFVGTNVAKYIDFLNLKNWCSLQQGINNIGSSSTTLRIQVNYRDCWT